MLSLSRGDWIRTSDHTPPDNYDYSIDNAVILFVTYPPFLLGLIVGLITAYNRDWFNNNYYCNKDSTPPRV